MSKQLIEFIAEKLYLSIEISQLKKDNEMQSKRIDWTVADNVKKAIEIENLNAARLKDSIAHEDAMSVLIKIMGDRLEIINDLQSATKFWRRLYIKMDRKRKILESKIRQDDRSFLRIEKEIIAERNADDYDGKYAPSGNESGISFSYQSLAKRGCVRCGGFGEWHVPYGDFDTYIIHRCDCTRTGSAR